MPKNLKKPRTSFMLLLDNDTVEIIKQAMEAKEWDNNPPNTFDRMIDVLILAGYQQLFPVSTPMK